MANTTVVIEYREADFTDADFIAHVEYDSKVESGLASPEECSVHFFRERWDSYLRGLRHPQFAEEPRVVFTAIVEGKVVGFIAGHFSRRYETQGELQSIHILKEFQSQGIGSELLRRLAEWFVTRHRQMICVGIDPENPYQRFYQKHHARRLNEHWFIWDDIETVLKPANTQN